MGKFMKKVGQLVLCVVPLLMMSFVQGAVAVIMMITMMVSFIVTGGDIFTFDVTQLLDGNSMMAIIISAQFLTFVIALAVYIWGFKNKKIRPVKETVSRFTIPVILLVFLGTEMLSGCYLELMSLAFPNLMLEYAQMLEESGLIDMTILSTIATLILAPLSEELVFRGITFTLARNFTGKFWIANIIQALLFGIAHGNFVQGSYAFALGLVLGYLYKCYNSIIIPMIGHLIFNFCGTFLVGFIFGDSEEVAILRLFIILVIAMAAVYGGIYICKNVDSAVPGGVSGFNTRYKLQYEAANTPRPVYPRPMPPQGYPYPNPNVQGGSYPYNGPSYRAPGYVEPTANPVMDANNCPTVGEIPNVTAPRQDNQPEDKPQIYDPGHENSNVQNIESESDEGGSES